MKAKINLTLEEQDRITVPRYDAAITFGVAEVRLTTGAHFDQLERALHEARGYWEKDRISGAVEPEKD